MNRHSHTRPAPTHMCQWNGLRRARYPNANMAANWAQPAKKPGTASTTAVNGKRRRNSSATQLAADRYTEYGGACSGTTSHTSSTAMTTKARSVAIPVRAGRLANTFVDGSVGLTGYEFTRSGPTCLRSREVTAHVS